MRKTIALGLLAVIAVTTLTGCACCTTGRCPLAREKGKVLRHVVLFTWKESTPPEKVREIEEAFAALPGTADMIADFEWGTDVSIEGIARGYTHAFLVTFKSEADRNAYIPHPDHKAFVELMKPHMSQVLVIDYWARR